MTIALEEQLDGASVDAAVSAALVLHALRGDANRRSVAFDDRAAHHAVLDDQFVHRR